MLEEQLAFYLEKYLGNYVKGLSREALKVSVWQGTQIFRLPLEFLLMRLVSLSPPLASTVMHK